MPGAKGWKRNQADGDLGIMISNKALRSRRQNTSIMKALHLKCSFVGIAFACLMISCDKHPGFEETESGIFRKLNAFGDCSPGISAAQFFIMEVTYKSAERQDSGYHFQLHHHALDITENEGDPIGLRLRSELDSMNCGDDITLLLPFSEFNRTFIGAYADTPSYHMQEQVELRLHLVKTFNLEGYTNYLMNAAQQDELSEAEAIELLLMNKPEHAYEKHGDCFIEFFKDTAGDSVKTGRDIKIDLDTYLMNGHALNDSPMSMQFRFGAPGQIIGGLQYGLSFLGEGDQARIYLPSKLAFGEGGNSNGLVPPHTPVYFDVHVTNVVSESELPI